MVLQTLEFSECLTDSPFFREKVHAHEKEIEKTSKSIKGLVKECSDLLSAASQLSKAQRSFSKLLTEFEFECIGTEKTDDEILIEKSLSEFGKIILTIEDARDNLLERVRTAVLDPMHGFRKDKIGEVKKFRQTFEKQTSKFYQSQERYLGLKPAKSSEAQLAEADESLDQERKGFCRESMDYVLMLQEVQERKKFEFVELLLQFMFSWLTFYHEGYELCNDFQPYLKDLSSKLQRCRANFESTKDEAAILKNKILESGAVPPVSRSYAREGYLFMLEKKALSTSWTKYYCQYRKDDKFMTLTPFNQLANNKISNSTPKETFTLTSCTRRAAESIEKRFCFDVTVQEKQQPITFQACSERDRRLWLDAMDGKEPIYAEPQRSNQLESLLDDIGFNFIKKCIHAIEMKGLEEEGLYRVVGVNSKVTKLTTILLDRKKAEKVDLLSELDSWEMKTITSALKNYFRALPEPLMTFKLHQKFIKAAKQESKTLRINDIHELIHQLPESNFEMLELLVAHLKKVSEFSVKNLMSVSNIGVCFGPTLMRPEEETMATIMDIKFCNLIVEILIENYEKIFKTRPEFADISNTRVLDSKPPAPVRNTQNNSSHNFTSNNQFSSTPLSLSTSLGGVFPSFKEPLPPQITQVMRKGNDAPRTPANGRSASTHVASLSISTPATNYLRSPQMNNLEVSHHSQRAGSKTISMPNAQLNPGADRHSSASSSSESLNFRCSNSSVSTTQSSYSTPGRPPKSQNKWSGNSTSTITSSSTYRKVRTLYSCTAENDSELSFEPNQLITNVRQSKEPGWLEGTLDGKSGLIPANYVEFIN